MTIKEIKRLVNNGSALDITSAKETTLEKIGNLKEIGYSTGVYGVNGALFISESGQLYAITARSSNLFRLL